MTEPNYKIIHNFRDSIDYKYMGLHALIGELLDKAKLNTVQIGGVLTKFKVDNENIKADVVYNKYSDRTIIQIVRLVGTETCGVIIIDKENKKEAVIQNVQGKDHCYVSTIDNTSNSKIIVRLLIEICKYYNIRKIRLGDNTHKTINNFKFELPYLYTLIKGYPWYIQFGFKNVNEEDQNKIINNYKLLKNKKVKDFDIKVFIDSEIIKFAKDNQETDIKIFIKNVTQFYTKNFINFYKKIYYNLDLQDISNREYYLDI